MNYKVHFLVHNVCLASLSCIWHNKDIQTSLALFVLEHINGPNPNHCCKSQNHVRSLWLTFTSDTLNLPSKQTWPIEQPVVETGLKQTYRPRTASKGRACGVMCTQGNEYHYTVEEWHTLQLQLCMLGWMLHASMLRALNASSTYKANATFYSPHLPRSTKWTSCGCFPAPIGSAPKIGSNPTGRRPAAVQDTDPVKIRNTVCRTNSGVLASFIPDRKL